MPATPSVAFTAEGKAPTTPSTTNCTATNNARPRTKRRFDRSSSGDGLADGRVPAPSDGAPRRALRVKLLRDRLDRGVGIG